MTADEIKELSGIRICPCPFCFHNIITFDNVLWCFSEYDDGENYGDTIAVMCPKCHSQGPEKKSRYMALMGWNAEDVGPEDYSDK